MKRACFYPTHPGKFDRPKYVEIDDDIIEEKALHCKKYEGTYFGPITPPSPDAY